MRDGIGGVEQGAAAVSGAAAGGALGVGRQSGLSATQRTEALLALQRGEEPAAAIVRRYGISGPTLQRYKSTFLEGGRAAVNVRTGAPQASADPLLRMERDLAERDRVIGELTIVNRVLKKLSCQSRCPKTLAP